jgi:L-cystine uptake protein TcyP (sodium:dicarboxylate symporter family)
VGAEIRVYDLDVAGQQYGTELSGAESHTSFNYVYEGGAGSQNNEVWIQILKKGYIEFGQKITMPLLSSSFFPELRADLN